MLQARLLKQNRSEYALAGDIVNLAARLAASAEKSRKGVLCDETTLSSLTGEVGAGYSTCSLILLLGLSLGFRVGGEGGRRSILVVVVFFFLCFPSATSFTSRVLEMHVEFLFMRFTCVKVLTELVRCDEPLLHQTGQGALSSFLFLFWQTQASEVCPL